MFSKTIEFEDFNGTPQKQEFYFHLSKGKILELLSSGLQKRLQTMLKEKDNTKMIATWRELITMSAGIRSGDGQRFLQDPESQSTLLGSPAYDELLFELCTDAAKSAEFVTNLLPEKLQKEMLAHLEKNKGDAEAAAVDPTDDRPNWMKEERLPTDEEMRGATIEQMKYAMSLKLKTAE